ncbi:MAG: DUF4340 domain-containing protein [Pseudomonadota bacterium]
MNLRKLSILAIIFILLGAYFYFYEVRAGREKKEAEEKAKKVIAFKPEDVEELRLTVEGKTTLFRKEKDEWLIKEPFHAKGDSDSIGMALASLERAAIERTVDDKASSLTDYGLDKPSMEITVKEKDNPPLETILLGGKNPTEYYVYVKRENSPAVMLTHSGLKDQLNKEIYYYRDKTILPLNVDAIKGLYLKYQAKGVDLRLDDKKDWQIIKPIKAKADGGVIRRLLYSIKNSKVKEFVEENPGDLQKYGLGSPEMEVTFLTDKRPPLKSLLIGDRVKADGDFYAKWNDAENVFLLPGSSLRDYPRTLFNLRDKKVLDFEKDKILRVELKYPHEQIVIENEGGDRWKITKPVSVKADEFEVSDLLWALLDMEAKGFVTDEAVDLQVYNLQKPAVEVNLWQKGEGKPLRLAISQKGDEKKNLYAKTSTKETIYQLDPSVLKDLTKTPFSLRDKSLLIFKNEEVGKVQLTYPDKTFILKLGPGDWKAIEPEKAILNKVEVISFLWDIRLLKFKEIVSERMKESPSVYGFDKSEAEIALWNNKDNKIGSIIIGKKMPDKDLLYAKVDFAPTVYGIDTEFLEKLPYSINDFK